MNSVLQDLRYALRKLLKSPAFSLLVIATLALGIGANTAVFSIIHGVLFRPLPFPHAERLVNLCAVHDSVGAACVMSPPDFEEWARSAQTADASGIGRAEASVLRTEQGSEGIPGATVSSSFLELFGVQPALGRLFRPDDALQPVVVLGHGFWMSRFGGDPTIVGRTITLAGKSHEVVGVAAAGVRIPEFERAQLWRPLQIETRNEKHRAWRGFVTVARLRPGTEIGALESELASLAGRLDKDFPTTNRGWGLTAVPLQQRMVASVRTILWVLWGAVAFVLLIACNNVANLLIARALGRQRELAVQAALGATRGRLIRQLLCESLILASIGGVAGVLLAWWAVHAFRTLAPPTIPRREELGVDGFALAFTVGVSVAASLLFGVLPALRAVGAGLMEKLRSAAQAPLERSPLSARRLLVISEVALALVLLVGAGLLTRSFVAAAQWQGGFDRSHLLVLWLLPPQSKYPERSAAVELYRRAAEHVGTVPGVTSVGAASAGPLFGGRETEEFSVDGSEPLAVRWSDIDEHYFQTMRIPVRRGRGFTTDDRPDGPKVAIVNETMARRLAPDGNALGRQIRRAGIAPAVLTIVGVVGDVNPLTSDGQVDPEIYWPNQQAPRWATYLIVRTSTDPSRIVVAARARLRDVDPDLSVRTIGTFDELIGERLVGPRFYMFVLGTFAFIALALAVGGTYSVIAQNVAARTKEIGLRMSLGATRPQILGLVIRQAASVVAVGVVLGLGGAIVVTRLLGSLLYNVTATDPLTFAGMTVLLVATALLAAYVPARRAARVDPLIAIRSE